MASSSKDQRPSEKIILSSEGDMISNLPDDVRVHILSLLPTKDAFRTCILSSKWENLWAVVPVLKFQPNNSIWENNNEDPGYVDFIERIFMSHNSDIKEFELFCTPLTDMSRLKAWISVVVERNVQVISILSFDKHLHLPDNLFTCKTLVSLILLFPLQLDVPTSIQFSCLKVLYVDLKSPSSALTEKLFCSSPVLEDLHITARYGDNNGRYIYNISSPSLKSLTVSISHSYCDNFKCVVNVDAPILELLEVDNVTSVHYTLKNSSALVKARLVSFRKEDLLLEKLDKLLKSVSCVKNLDLIGSLPMLVFGSASKIKWPDFGNVSRLELTIRDHFDFPSFSRFPVFPNLKHLILFVLNDFASKNLSDLLELAPDLVSLTFYRSDFRTVHNKFNYSEQRVPGCFRSCLREFAVSNFDGSESEVNLIKYLLVNAQALKKMSVSVSRKIRSETAKMDELRTKLKELLSMTKYSEDLEFCIT